MCAGFAANQVVIVVLRFYSRGPVTRKRGNVFWGEANYCENTAVILMTSGCGSLAGLRSSGCKNGLFTLKVFLAAQILDY